MAAVTLPGYSAAPPAAPEPPKRRRWWLVGLVSVWIVVVAALGWYSVRSDPATVPEQRDIAEALPVLERATGAMLAAATSGTDRAVVLGELRVARDCSVTPVRRGVEATRDVTVYVPADRALKVLEEIAAALPDDWHAEAGDSSGGRRVGLHADAGGFVGIDAAADADTQVFQLRASTGCRPTADGADLSPADVPAASMPASLTAALAALGGSGPATGSGGSLPGRRVRADVHGGRCAGPEGPRTQPARRDSRRDRRARRAGRVGVPHRDRLRGDRQGRLHRARQRHHRLRLRGVRTVHPGRRDRQPAPANRRQLVDERLRALGHDLLDEDGGARDPDAGQDVVRRDPAPGGALRAER